MSRAIDALTAELAATRGLRPAPRSSRLRKPVVEAPTTAPVPEAAEAIAPSPALLTTEEVAALAGITTRIVRKAIDDRRLEVAERGIPGRSHRFALEQVQAWIASRQGWSCLDCERVIRKGVRCATCSRRHCVEVARAARAATRTVSPIVARVVAPVVPPIVAPVVVERPAPTPPPPPIPATRDMVDAITAGRAAWLACRWTVGADGIPDPRGFWLVRRADGRFDADRVGASLGPGDRAIEQHWRTGDGVWQHKQIAVSGQMVDPPALPGSPMYSRSIREIAMTVRMPRRREVEP